jgi:hypothetical protein
VKGILWNTATADRNIANSLKGFAREFFKFAKVIGKLLSS